MTMRGIDAASVYLPRYRLPASEIREAWGRSSAGGIVRKAVAGADEDALTMAVAAIEGLLDGPDAPVDRQDVAHLILATTTPPAEEGSVLGGIVRALGLEADVSTALVGGSTAAGAAALERGLDVEGTAIVVAADHPAGEPADADHALGAGAVAFAIREGAAVVVTDRHRHVDQAPGVRFRPRGAEKIDSLGITGFERAIARRSVGSSLKGLSTDLESVDAAVLPQPDPRFPARLSRGVPIGPEQLETGTIVDRLGDAGAATVPIAMANAIDGSMGTRSGSRHVVAAFYGGGEAAAFSLEGTIKVTGLEGLEGGVELSYMAYLRHRGRLTGGEPAGGGAYVSMPTWYESLPQRYRLLGGRCPSCSSLNFPPRGACSACYQSVAFEPVSLPRTGEVRAVTVIDQGGAPPEFAEQQRRSGAFAVAIVALPDPADDGEEVWLPAQLTDVEPEEVEVGDDVRAVVRRIYEQEAVPRYGVKFAPVREPEQRVG